MPEHFELACPWVFLLLPLPLLIILMPTVRLQKKSLKVPFFGYATCISGVQAQKGVPQAGRRWFQQVIIWIYWFMALTALARPQLVGEPDLIVKESRNFLMAADISHSMAQKDWEIGGEKSSRWAAVKSLMGNFIHQRQGDRMGVMLFGSNAYTLAPFTSDNDALLQLLDDTEVGMAGQQTNIGRVIGKGISLFANDTLPHKVMLLLTDGADSGIGISPFDAASLANSDSITIHTIGIGDPDKPHADLDEAALQQIANLTNGQYFLAKDTEEMAQVFALLDEIAPVEYEQETFVPVQELYFFPLALLLACSFFASLIIHLKHYFKRSDSHE